MKKIDVVAMLMLPIFAITACKNNNTEASKKNVESVSMYVDSLAALKSENSLTSWSMLDSGYQLRMKQAEKDAAILEAVDKAKLDSSRAKYATLKAIYENNLNMQQEEADKKLKKTEALLKIEVDKNKMMKADMKVAAKPDFRMILRNRLFGEGKIGTDMKFEFVNAKNILSVYENFVNTVAENKKLYSREDWDEIKVLYEALDNRKNTVEKEGLSRPDNRKIAVQKIRFATIRVGRRFATKIKENEEAKK